MLGKTQKTLSRPLAFSRSMLFGTVIILCLLPALLAVHLSYSGPPHSITRLCDVEPGMSQEEVFRILGRPKKIINEGRVAYYYRPLSFGTLYVYFTEDKKYERWYYEPY